MPGASDATAGKRSSGAGVVYLFKQASDNATNVALLITVSPQ